VNYLPGGGSHNASRPSSNNKQQQPYVSYLSDISEPYSPPRVKFIGSSSSQEYHGGDCDDIISLSDDNLSDDDEEEEEMSEEDGSCDCEDADRNSRISANVWKQKQGISKTFKKTYAFASEKATTFKSNFKHKSKDLKARQQDTASCWERRKIVLVGRNLMYYHKKAEIDDSINPLEKENKMTPLNKLKKSFSDVAQEKDAIKLKISRNTPRGVIDIVARRAVVSVSTSKNAPTPYTLCIAMKSEDKWVLCFEDQKELMKWLYALTAINVKRSERLSLKSRKGYQHSSPGITQDKWLKRFSVKELAVTGDDTMEDEDDTEATQDQHSIDDHEEMCEQVPLLSSVPEHRYNYSSVEPLPLPPSSAWISLSRQDVIILVAIVNVSFAYICYLAIKHETIAMSYLYIVLVVNGGSYCILNRNNYHTSVDTATTNSQYQFTRNGQKLSTTNNTHMQRSNRWGTHADTTSLHTSSIRSSRDSGRSQTKPIQYGSVESAKKLSNGHMQQSSSQIKTIPRANMNGWKPKAGASMIRISEPSDSCLNKNNTPMIRWRPAPVSVAETRSADYLTSKAKISCPASLYELVRADIFESDDQMLEIGQRVNLSEIKLDYDLEENENKTWNAPDIFVISLTLPTTAPKLGRTNNDDKGYILTGYYRMREETRQILKVVTRPDYDPIQADKVLFAKLRDENQKKMINGVKLWEDWCRCAPTDEEMQKRFKFIAKGDNLREVGCPGWICNYNGKPITIKKPGKTGFLFSYDNMMEFNLSLLPFPYLFKSAMTYLKENLFGKMLMTFSFVIEGRSSDELPELLIGNGLQVCFLHAENVYNAKDVFGGTSPTSF